VIITTLLEQEKDRSAQEDVTKARKNDIRYRLSLTHAIFGWDGGEIVTTARADGKEAVGKR
jgi:hypothetical protein